MMLRISTVTPEKLVLLEKIVVFEYKHFQLNSVLHEEKTAQHNRESSYSEKSQRLHARRQLVHHDVSECFIRRMTIS